MNKVIIILIVLFVKNAFSQEESIISLTLEDAIKISKEQSPNAQIAKNQLVNKYWQYRTYRADLLPNISLQGTIPDLNRSISVITLPTGQDAFVHRSQSVSGLNMSMNQNIGLTGGNVFVRTGLQRIDVLGSNASFSYLSNPVLIGFNQPIMTFNQYRWLNKIQPIIYEEAKREYIEMMEQLSIDAVNNFFDLYLAQINLDMAQKNLANNDTLYRIAQGRYNLGKIAENDLLMMELSFLNSSTNFESAKLDLQIAAFSLRNFLGYKTTVMFRLIPTTEIPDFFVDVTLAMEQAKKNRKRVLELDRQILEAKRDVAQAKGESGFRANLFGTFGLTQSATTVADAYANPQQQEMATVGIQMPILNWNKAKAQRKMAEANLELVRTTVEQEGFRFEQEIFIKASLFNIQRKQLMIAAKADTVAQKQYDISKQRYLIGKIDNRELNLVLNDKDMARRSHVEAIRSYWFSYYDIRKSTLYDFHKNKLLYIEYNPRDL